MNVSCGACGKSYRIDEARFAGRTRVRLRCPACQGIIEVTAVASPPDAPAAGRATQAGGPHSGEGRLQAGAPSLPEGKRVSLAILSGPDQGKIVEMKEPRLVIGRSDSDLVLEDPEVSRQHAVVEVYADRILLRDLSSTNGTFVGERKITAHELEEKEEFRLGASRMMLIMTVSENA